MIYCSLLIIAQLPGGGAVAVVPSLQVIDPSYEVPAEQTSAIDPEPSDIAIEEEQFPDTLDDDAPSDMANEEGVIVVTAGGASSRIDPLQDVNRASYEVVRSVDEAVTGPLARGYKRTVPSPVRDGVRNALRNLGEPVVAINFLLQLKPGKSLETLGRFAINSTFGIGGLFDVAKESSIDLPYRVNGLGHTAGYYGVKPGPYMYLPLIGPTTVRDLIGRVGDMSLVPVAVGGPFRNPLIVAPATTVRLIDERAEADGAIQATRADEDPYYVVRSNYLAQRQAEIDNLRGTTKDNPESRTKSVGEEQGD
jgi:phospholipid-binding lipoprotein MlaA